MKENRLPVAEPLIGEKELEYVSDAVRSGWVSSRGKYVEMFEGKFAGYCGSAYGVSTANGTVALHLALESLGIGVGDEVIVPTLTFIATANVVTYTGAKPVFCDAQREYWCIDPLRIEEKITPRTRAIIPVHLYGHPADMDPIMELAKRYNLYVIEDAAEAHGAEYKGRKVGSIGDIGAFSFFGNKIITTGEGGMIVTNDQQIAERADLLKNQGTEPSRKYWHPVIGFNYRMTNLQAALGVAQTERLDEFVEKKRLIAKWYQEMVTVDGVTFQSEASWARSAYWMPSIVVDEQKLGVSRDELMERFDERGIETRPVFYSLHTLPPYRDSEEFPVSERLSRGGINLPSGVSLQQGDVARVAGALNELGRP